MSALRGHEPWGPQPCLHTMSVPVCQVLYKIFQLLGLRDHLQSFTLLKGKEKLLRMDDIFKKICAEMGWPFLPS